MFLLAITQNSLKSRLYDCTVNEFQWDSNIYTLVTDDLLSRVSTDSEGFKLIEAPTDNCILVEIVYQKQTDILKIYQSVMSGISVYYHINTDGEFFCASHISLLRKCGITIKENTEVLPEFFVFRYIMPPHTLYKNIFHLPPGSTLFLKQKERKYYIAEHEIYIPPLSGSTSVNESQVAQIAADHISELLQILAPHQEKLAVLLSGGLDSSILFKMCQNLYNTTETYSTGYPFEDPELNVEKNYAITASKAFGTSHTYYSATHKDYLDGVIKSISCAEMPIHHMQSALLFMLFESGIPEEKKFIINGEGGDGQWGRDTHYQLYLSYKTPVISAAHALRKFNLIPKFMQLSHTIKKGRNLMAAIDTVQRRTVPLSDPDNIVWSSIKYGDEEWVCSYFQVKREEIIRFRYNTLQPYYDRNLYDLVSLMGLLGYVPITTSIWSKLAESCKRIIIYPYLSLNVVDYAYSLPWDMKSRKRKNVLRSVAHHLNIPDFIINRPKTGFGLKKPNWAEKSGPFECLIPLASKVFDEGEIRRMHLKDEGKRQIFWNILNYAIWKRLCILHEPVSLLLGELNEYYSFYASKT